MSDSVQIWGFILLVIQLCHWRIWNFSIKTFFHYGSYVIYHYSYFTLFFWNFQFIVGDSVWYFSKLKIYAWWRMGMYLVQALEKIFQTNNWSKNETPLWQNGRNVNSLDISFFFSFLNQCYFHVCQCRSNWVYVETFCLPLFAIMCFFHFLFILWKYDENITTKNFIFDLPISHMSSRKTVPHITNIQRFGKI